MPINWELRHHLPAACGPHPNNKNATQQTKCLAPYRTETRKHHLPVRRSCAAAAEEQHCPPGGLATVAARTGAVADHRGPVVAAPRSGRTAGWRIPWGWRRDGAPAVAASDANGAAIAPGVSRWPRPVPGSVRSLWDLLRREKAACCRAYGCNEKKIILKCLVTVLIIYNNHVSILYSKVTVKCCYITKVSNFFSAAWKVILLNNIF